MWIGNYNASMKFQFELDLQKQPQLLQQQQQHVMNRVPLSPQEFVTTTTKTTTTDREQVDQEPQQQQKHKQSINKPKSSSSSSSSSAKKTNTEAAAAVTTSTSTLLLPLTLYLEPLDTLQSDHEPLPNRTTSADKLIKIDLSSNFTSTSSSSSSSLFSCNNNGSTNTSIISSMTFPIDDIPIELDPYIPWIHDIFLTHDMKSIQIIAQNKRRCDSGDKRYDKMKLMEPQISLFQPIPIIMLMKKVKEVKEEDTEEVDTEELEPEPELRLSPTLENATHPETRFICRFHYHPTTSTNTRSNSNTNFSIPLSSSMVTLSEYPFNYEYVHWRKSKKQHPMVQRVGKDITSFWLSTLLFTCPIPNEYQSILSLQQQQQIHDDNDDNNSFLHLVPPNILYLDIIPIRTPVRIDEYLLTKQHVGPTYVNTILKRYDTRKKFGTNHVIPKIQDSGRWENIPICPRYDIIQQQKQQLNLPVSTKEEDFDANNNHGGSGGDNIIEKTEDGGTSMASNKKKENNKKPYRLILCTWTSASYTRRGDATRISDSGQRLLEWIEYHWMVGFEHIFIYDNSPTDDDDYKSDLNTTTSFTATTASSSNINYKNNTTSRNTELQDVIDKYFTTKDGDTPGITIHRWPAKVCNNNRPQHPNPGERSSQYAAEASCRTRYGPLSDWLAFIDTDEYLVPMMKTSSSSKSEMTTMTTTKSSPKSPNLSSVPNYPTWYPVLDEMEKKQINVLKMLSSRGRPRIDLME